jgi:hypothetical protein
MTEAVERAMEAAAETDPTEASVPNPSQVRASRERVHEGLEVPQVEATSSDPSVEVYVRLNAVKKPPSTDLVFIIGNDLSPHPQGGMTFVKVDAKQMVVDSKKNEDGYKFLTRLGNAIAGAGFQVSLERSANLVSGPVIARIRIRRATA